MKLTEIILLSISLAMDAFSVSVCKGLSMKRIDYKGGAITALSFGVFQAVMPLIGYFLGSQFASYITSFSHWVAFVLLGFICGKLIYVAVHEDGEEEGGAEYKFDFKELIILSIATSIDALAVGIVFATEETNVALSVCLIGIITAVLSFAGVIIGNKFGSKYEKKAEIAGGVVLVLIGVKLLLEGLGVF
ncbi:MAG: manganese efflux pump MntP family protein [Ruminococcus sp.]|nr:manganese efflux pump MntP family protein [Ruminococcus sp.]